MPSWAGFYDGYFLEVTQKYLYTYKYMYRYVGHVISAMEKSDLDQVLSRKRPTVARDEVQHSVWCFLDVPHQACLPRRCPGRPRPCSRRLPGRGAVFVYSSNFPCVYSYVLIDIFLRYSCKETGGSKVDYIPSENEVTGSNPGVLPYVVVPEPFSQLSC